MTPTFARNSASGGDHPDRQGDRVDASPPIGGETAGPEDVHGEEHGEVDDHADDGRRDAGQRRDEASWSCVRSTSGPPARMNRNDGRNVKNVATHRARDARGETRIGAEDRLAPAPT